MLDIKHLRDNFDDVKKMLNGRGFELDQETFTSLDEKRKVLQISVESLQADRKKLSSTEEASKFIKNLGVDEDVPRRYNETELDKIVNKLEAKGIEADHNAFMDVS